jgi:hypothetical protein
VAFQAVAGTNQVLVTLKDNNSNTVFSDWLQFVAAEPFPVLNIGTNITADTSANSTNVSFTSLNSAISGVSLGGQNLSAPAPTTSGGWPAGGVGPVLATNDPYAIWVTNYTGSPTNFLVSVNGAAVAGNPGPTIGLSYGPAETRRFAPEGTANFPPVSPVVAITNVIALPAGGIQFNFNVPAGTNYVIESSGNLVDWQTIHNGVGQVGGEESYTNAAGTDTVQFYRIKL